MFSKEKMMEWIERFTEWPHRRTGTQEGRESAEYVKNMFRQFGLQDVRIEAAPSMCAETKKCMLKIGGKTIGAFLTNGTNRFEEAGLFLSELNGVEIAYVGDGSKESFENTDVKGKLVLCDVHFTPHVWKNKEGAIRFDPDGVFEKERRIYNVYIPENYAESYETAMRKGAAGYIGCLRDFMDQYYYNEDYTYILDLDGFMAMPSVWISHNSGDEILKMLEQTPGLKGDLAVETHYECKDALNVVGVLPGKSDDVMVIHSHHDATVRGAVQDASGMSVVFSLAEYFASLPSDEIGTTLMFLSTDSHFTDYEGHDKFLDRRAVEKDSIVLDFCIEHIAKAAELDENNKMKISDMPETRILFVTDTDGLPDIAQDAFRKYDLGHTLIHIAAAEGSADYDPEYVNSDAYCFHERGIPVVSLLSAPMYLSHSSDDIDKVHEDSLEGIAEAYRDMIIQAWKAMGYL